MTTLSSFCATKLTAMQLADHNEDVSSCTHTAKKP